MIMDNLRLALLSSLDFLVVAVWFSGESGLDILQIQYGYEYGYVWSRSFGRYIFSVVKSSLFATKSSGIVEEPRAVFLHLFRVGHVLSFPAFSGWLVELFTIPFQRVQRFYARGDHGRNRNNHLWVKNSYFIR